MNAQSEDDEPDPFETLGLKQDALWEQVQRAFVSRVQETNPERDYARFHQVYQAFRRLKIRFGKERE